MPDELVVKKKRPPKPLTPEQKVKAAASSRASYLANKEKVLARSKARYEANKDAVLANCKAYREANKSARAEYFRAYHLANKDSISAKHKANYAKNKPAIAARHLAYRLANPEKTRARALAYSESNRVAINTAQAAYRAANRAAIAEKRRLAYSIEPSRFHAYAKKWAAKNPESTLAYWSTNRAKRDGAEGAHTGHDIKALFASQRGACPNCQALLIKRGAGKYHLDHILPIALGGSNWPSNLQLLCPPCNMSKGAKHPDVWMTDNPRKRAVDFIPF